MPDLWDDPAYVKKKLDEYADKYGVPREMVHNVARVESNYRPRVYGTPTRHGRAYGTMQLMDKTARGLGVDRFDPDQNLQGGVKLLNGLRRKYGPDRPHLVYAAYNAGEGNVDKHGGVPPFKETQNYVAKAMGGRYTPERTQARSNFGPSYSPRSSSNPKPTDQLRSFSDALKKVREAAASEPTEGPVDPYQRLEKMAGLYESLMPQRQPQEEYQDRSYSPSTYTPAMPVQEAAPPSSRQFTAKQELSSLDAEIEDSFKRMRVSEKKDRRDVPFFQQKINDLYQQRLGMLEPADVQERIEYAESQGGKYVPELTERYKKLRKPEEQLAKRRELQEAAAYDATHGDQSRDYFKGELAKLPPEEQIYGQIGTRQQIAGLSDTERAQAEGLAKKQPFWSIGEPTREDIAQQIASSRINPGRFNNKERTQLAYIQDKYGITDEEVQAATPSGVSGIARGVAGSLAESIGKIPRGVAEYGVPLLQAGASPGGAIAAVNSLYDPERQQAIKTLKRKEQLWTQRNAPVYDATNQNFWSGKVPQTIGGMLPAAAVALATGGAGAAASGIATGLTAAVGAGADMADAIDQQEGNIDPLRRQAAITLAGTSEGVLEPLLGVGKYVGGKKVIEGGIRQLLTKAATQAARNTEEHAALQFVGKLGRRLADTKLGGVAQSVAGSKLGTGVRGATKTMAGEAIEEGMQAVVDAFNRAKVSGIEPDALTGGKLLDDVLESAALGAVAGGIVGSPGIPRDVREAFDRRAEAGTIKQYESYIKNGKDGQSFEEFLSTTGGQVDDKYMADVQDTITEWQRRAQAIDDLRREIDEIEKGTKQNPYPDVEVEDLKAVLSQVETKYGGADSPTIQFGRKLNGRNVPIQTSKRAPQAPPVGTPSPTGTPPLEAPSPQTAPVQPVTATPIPSPAPIPQAPQTPATPATVALQPGSPQDRLAQLAASINQRLAAKKGPTKEQEAEAARQQRITETRSRIAESAASAYEGRKVSVQEARSLQREGKRKEAKTRLAEGKEEALIHKEAELRFLKDLETDTRKTMSAAERVELGRRKTALTKEIGRLKPTVTKAQKVKAAKAAQVRPTGVDKATAQVQNARTMFSEARAMASKGDFANAENRLSSVSNLLGIARGQIERGGGDPLQVQTLLGKVRTARAAFKNYKAVAQQKRPKAEKLQTLRAEMDTAFNDLGDFASAPQAVQSTPASPSTSEPNILQSRARRREELSREPESTWLTTEQKDVYEGSAVAERDKRPKSRKVIKEDLNVAQSIVEGLKQRNKSGAPLSTPYAVFTAQRIHELTEALKKKKVKDMPESFVDDDSSWAVRTNPYNVRTRPDIDLPKHLQVLEGLRDKLTESTRFKYVLPEFKTVVANQVELAKEAVADFQAIEKEAYAQAREDAASEETPLTEEEIILEGNIVRDRMWAERAPELSKKALSSLPLQKPELTNLNPFYIPPDRPGVPPPKSPQKPGREEKPQPTRKPGPTPPSKTPPTPERKPARSQEAKSKKKALTLVERNLLKAATPVTAKNVKAAEALVKGMEELTVDMTESEIGKVYENLRNRVREYDDTQKSGTLIEGDDRKKLEKLLAQKNPIIAAKDIEALRDYVDDLQDYRDRIKNKKLRLPKEDESAKGKMAQLLQDKYALASERLEALEEAQIRETPRKAVKTVVLPMHKAEYIDTLNEGWQKEVGKYNSKATTDELWKDVRAVLVPDQKNASAIFLNKQGIVALVEEMDTREGVSQAEKRKAAEDTVGLQFPSSNDFIAWLEDAQDRVKDSAGLDSLIERAKKYRDFGSQTFVVIDSSRSPNERDLQLLHEYIHVWQDEATGRFDKAARGPVKRLLTQNFWQNEPLAGKITSAFEKEAAYKGQPEAELDYEAGAYVASGQYDWLGLTDKEAEDFLGRYFSAIAEKHGKEAFDKLPKMADTAVKVVKSIAEGKYDRKRESGLLEGTLKKEGRESDDEGGLPERGSEGSEVRKGRGSVRGEGTGGNEGRVPRAERQKARAAITPTSTEPRPFWESLEGQELLDLYSAERVGDIEDAALKKIAESATYDPVKHPKLANILPGARAIYWLKKLKESRYVSSGRKSKIDTKIEKIEEKQIETLEGVIKSLDELMQAHHKIAVAQQSGQKDLAAQKEFMKKEMELISGLSRIGDYTSITEYITRINRASIFSTVAIPMWNVIQQGLVLPLHISQKHLDFLVPTKWMAKHGLKYTKELMQGATFRKWAADGLKNYKEGKDSFVGDMNDLWTYGALQHLIAAEAARRQAGLPGARAGSEMYEIGHRARGGGRILDSWVAGVGKVQGLADVAGRSVSFNFALHSIADGIARHFGKQQGWSEAQIEKRRTELLEDGLSTQMVIAAADESARFVLDYPTFFYEKLMKLRGTGTRPMAKTWQLVFDLLAPVTKIPLAGVDQALFRYSPIGLGRFVGNVLYEQTRSRKREAKIKTPEDVKTFQVEQYLRGRETAEILRQGVVGSFVWGLASFLSYMGMIAFSAGDDDRERVDSARELLGEGYDPELQIPGLGIALPLKKMGAAGQSLAFADSVWTAYKTRIDPQTGEREDTITRNKRLLNKAVSGVAADNPFGNFVKGLAAVTSDDEKGGATGGIGGLAGDRVASFVPSILRDSAVWMDKYKVTPDTPDWWGRLKYSVGKAVPGVRGTFKPRLGATGEKIEEYPRYTPWRSLKQDDRAQFLQYLKETGIGLAKPKRDPKESSAEYNLRLKEIGQLQATRLKELAPVLQSAMPEVEKRSLLRRALGSQELKHAAKISASSRRKEDRINAVHGRLLERVVNDEQYKGWSLAAQKAANAVISNELSKFKAQAGSEDQKEVPAKRPRGLGRILREAMRAGRTTQRGLERKLQSGE